MMSESVLEQARASSTTSRLPGEGRRVSIIGVPCGFGASVAGVDLGPAAMRVAGLRQSIARLGYEVRDLGDMRVECPQAPPASNEKLRYLNEIVAACEPLA